MKCWKCQKKIWFFQDRIHEQKKDYWLDAFYDLVKEYWVTVREFHRNCWIDYQAILES